MKMYPSLPPPGRWDHRWEIPTREALREHIGCHVSFLSVNDEDGGLILGGIERRGILGPWEAWRWWGPGSEKIHITPLSNLEGFRCDHHLDSDNVHGSRTRWIR